jgi:hypothetical protein
MEKTKEKKNCKDLDIGDDLMKFTKITTPQSLHLFFIFFYFIYIYIYIFKKKKMIF